MQILQKMYESSTLGVFFSQAWQTRSFLFLAFFDELCYIVALVGKSVSLKVGGVGSNSTACLVIWPDAGVNIFRIFLSDTNGLC
jgi:hypothetical protein